jgi:hypothetical protein
MHAAPPASATANCPSCGTPLSRGASICNLSTGKRPVAGRSGARRKLGGSGQSSTTPWIIVGILALLLGVGFYFGRGNTAIMLAVVIIANLYLLGVGIAVLIAAFSESVGTGFLTMCVPFYAFYFVYGVNENSTLKILFAGAVILNIGLRLLTFIG